MRINGVGGGGVWGVVGRDEGEALVDGWVGAACSWGDQRAFWWGEEGCEAGCEGTEDTTAPCSSQDCR